MSSKSHIYFQNLKKQAQEQADHMNTLHKLFGFNCYIPNAPVTRSHRISDFVYSVGLGPEMKKQKKERKQSSGAPNYRKMTIEIFSRAKKLITSSDLADKMGVSKSTAKRHLQDLYAEGFLKRMQAPATTGNNLTYLYSKNERSVIG